MAQNGECEVGLEPTLPEGNRILSRASQSRPISVGQGNSLATAYSSFFEEGDLGRSRLLLRRSRAEPPLTGHGQRI